MTKPPIRVRIRFFLGESALLGPGKMDLLEAIEETGSISEAAREMGMSYKRAWSLVRSMNEAFREPLVHCAKGGVSGGGAQLTDLGRRVLTTYRAAEEEAVAASERHFRKLLRWTENTG